MNKGTGQITPNGMNGLPRRQVVATFAGVMLAMFLASLDQTVVGTAMPQIIADLGGFERYTWVTSAYIISSAVAVPITGKLSDMYGRKPFYVVGLVVFVLASLLCGLSNSMTQIIVFRGIQGLGAGVMMANAFTVIADLFPPAKRGKYQGLLSGVFGLSSVIGPTLGGYLTDSLSWHWVFFVNIPLGVLVIAMFVFMFPNVRPDSLKHQIDYFGLATLVLTVVPAMLALSWGGVEFPWRSSQILGMFAFSAVMLVAFLVIESRSREPIVPLSLFKDRVVAVCVAVTFLTAFGMFGSIVFIPLFFQGVLGSTATASGGFLTPMMLSVVTGTIIGGQMVSRGGARYPVIIGVGIVIMSAGMAMLSRMSPDTSHTRAVMNIIVTGFGVGITLPTLTIAVQNVVPYKVLGVATSSIQFFRSIGGAVGLAIFGSVLTNRFSAELVARLPEGARDFIPADKLASLAGNPQALAGIDPQSQALVLTAVRQSLSSAMSWVFTVALIAVAAAFVINMVNRHVPLREQHAFGGRPATDSAQGK